MEHCLYAMYDLLEEQFNIDNFDIAIQNILNNIPNTSNDFLTKIIELYNMTRLDNNYNEFERAFYIALFCRRNSLTDDLNKIVDNYNGQHRDCLMVLQNSPMCKDVTYIHQNHKYYWCQQFLHYLNRKFIYNERFIQ